MLAIAGRNEIPATDSSRIPVSFTTRWRLETGGEVHIVAGLVGTRSSTTIDSASKTPALTPAQIGGIFAGTFGTIVLLGLLFCWVGRRRRNYPTPASSVYTSPPSTPKGPGPPLKPFPVVEKPFSKKPSPQLVSPPVLKRPLGGRTVAVEVPLSPPSVLKKPSDGKPVAVEVPLPPPTLARTTATRPGSSKLPPLKEKAPAEHRPPASEKPRQNSTPLAPSNINTVPQHQTKAASQNAQSTTAAKAGTRAPSPKDEVYQESRPQPPDKAYPPPSTAPMPIPIPPTHTSKAESTAAAPPGYKKPPSVDTTYQGNRAPPLNKRWPYPPPPIHPPTHPNPPSHPVEPPVDPTPPNAIPRQDLLPTDLSNVVYTIDPGTKAKKKFFQRRPREPAGMRHQGGQIMQLGGFIRKRRKSQKRKSSRREEERIFVVESGSSRGSSSEEGSASTDGSQSRSDGSYSVVDFDAPGPSVRIVEPRGRAGRTE